MNYEIGMCFTPIESTNTFKLPNFLSSDKVEYEITINDSIVDKSSYVVKDNEILFNTDYSDGSIIKVKCKLSSNIPKTIISNNPKNIKALFNKKYTDDTLYENTKYSLNLKINEEYLNTDFTTKLKPFYSSIIDVRDDTGTFLNEIPNDTILRYLYENSIAVENKEIAAKDKDVTLEITDNDKSKWVRYKTDVDLLNVQYLSINGNYGSISKITGPIQIKKSVKLPYLDKLLQGAKANLDDAEKAFTTTVIATGFVKAGNTSYPLESRLW